MDVTERVAYLNKIYSLAVAKGKCKNRAELAGLLGIAKASLYCAMRGRYGYNTDSLIAKVRRWAEANDIDIDDIKNKETKEMFQTLINVLNRIADTLERPGKIITIE